MLLFSTVLMFILCLSLRRWVRETLSFAFIVGVVTTGVVGTVVVAVIVLLDLFIVGVVVVVVGCWICCCIVGAVVVVELLYLSELLQSMR